MVVTIYDSNILKFDCNFIKDIVFQRFLVCYIL